MSITGIAGMINLKALRPELVPPPELFAGSIASFGLRVHNAKRFIPSFLIRIECQGGEGAWLPLVPAGGFCDGTIGLVFERRGVASIGTITISSPFPVNFFTRYWSFVIDNTILVFPRLLQGSMTGDGNDRVAGGGNSQYGRGDAGELERIGIYSGSEPLKRIHWKLSARGDELLVKEFGRISAPPLLIDLDMMEGRELEERISRAAWLTRRWIMERPVGLRLGGHVIPPESGHRHGMLILKELALYGS